MLVQDPSCCNGALRVPDHLKLEEKFDLIIAVVLLILFFFFFFEGLAVQGKEISILLLKLFRSGHFWYREFKILEENLN